MCLNYYSKEKRQTEILLELVEKQTPVIVIRTQNSKQTDLKPQLFTIDTYPLKNDKLDYKELQSLVGGYFTLINISPDAMFDNYDMYVEEFDVDKDLPINLVASTLTKYKHQLKGNAVLVLKKYSE